MNRPLVWLLVLCGCLVAAGAGLTLVDVLAAEKDIAAWELVLLPFGVLGGLSLAAAAFLMSRPAGRRPVAD